ncbi:MAG: YqgE/AlgH family protein [Pseudomonadota bacterium]
MTLIETSEKIEQGRFLDGNLLIAMPGMADPRFARTLVYICAHSSDGAMGLVVNQLAEKMSFRQLISQLDIFEEDEMLADAKSNWDTPVHQGGPVETGRGFVLHSSDYYRDNSTLMINDEFSLTATLDVLRAIVTGTGPDRSVVALGYAGWAPGQLESEMQENSWLHCTCEPDLIFDHDVETKYGRAVQTLGFDLSMLATEAGHA